MEAIKRSSAMKETPHLVQKTEFQTKAWMDTKELQVSTSGSKKKYAASRMYPKQCYYGLYKDCANSGRRGEC